MKQFFVHNYFYVSAHPRLHHRCVRSSPSGRQMGHFCDSTPQKCSPPVNIFIWFRYRECYHPFRCIENDKKIIKISPKSSLNHLVVVLCTKSIKLQFRRIVFDTFRTHFESLKVWTNSMAVPQHVCYHQGLLLIESYHISDTIWTLVVLSCW